MRFGEAIVYNESGGICSIKNSHIGLEEIHLPQEENSLNVI